RCICTRTTVASSSMPGKLPGNSVNSPASFAATIASPSSGPAGVVLFMLTPCAELTADGVLPFPYSCRQLAQLTAATTTAAAASVQPAYTAARRAFTVLCRVWNSCRSRISTRAGASASCVSVPTACKSARKVCQFSCNAAQRAHERRCSRAALSTGSSPCIVSRSSPASSNSSHVIAASPAKLSPARARALRCVPQHLQLRQQERPPAVQPRTNRAHWTIQQPRRFVVTQFFQPAQHHRFAKLHGQLQYRCANLFPPLANFRPLDRRHRLKCLASLPYDIFHEFFVQPFPRRPLQMFHHAIARNAIQKRPQRTPLRIELFRLSNQGHENVLHNFLGRPNVSRHPQGKAIKRGLMAAIQLRKGLFIALRRAAQQYVVPFLCLDVHLSWCDARLTLHTSRATQKSSPVPGNPTTPLHSIL